MNCTSGRTFAAAKNFEPQKWNRCNWPHSGPLAPEWVKTKISIWRSLVHIGLGHLRFLWLTIDLEYSFWSSLLWSKGPKVASLNLVQRSETIIQTTEKSFLFLYFCSQDGNFNHIPLLEVIYSVHTSLAYLCWQFWILNGLNPITCGEYVIVVNWLIQFVNFHIPKHPWAKIEIYCVGTVRRVVNKIQ